MVRMFWFFGMWLVLFGCGGKAAEEETTASFDAMQMRFLDEDLSDEVRLACADTLMAQGQGRAFFVAQYWTPQRPLVQKLVDRLIVSDPDQAARLLAGLMAAAGGEVKLHFESRLLKLGDAAVDALVELAESNPDWQTAMQVMDALGKLKAPQGVEVIRAHLSHSNDWVRLSAAHALGEVGNDEAVAALITTLKDTSDTVVAAALIGLGKTGNKRAFQACVKRLAHNNPRVRSAAVSAVGRMGDDAAREVLTPLLNDPDEGVRFKVETALTALNSN